VQATMAMIGAGATLTVIAAGFADRRRQQRRDLDRVGFMPWPLITVMATLVALLAFAIALVGGR
jgi:hypothetical protein